MFAVAAVRSLLFIRISRKAELEIGKTDLWCVSFYASARSTMARLGDPGPSDSKHLQHSEKASKSNRMSRWHGSSPKPIPEAKLDSVRGGQEVPGHSN